MNRSLTLRLTLFFLAVALVTALLVFLTVRISRGSEFQSLIAQRETALLEEIIRDYYERYGSLAGFSAYARRRFAPDGPPPPANEQPILTAILLRRPLGVVDPTGDVLIPNERYRPRERVPPGVVERSTPVLVDGEPVAFILPPEGNAPFRLRVEEQLYLQRTNRALLLATIGAVVVALLLGAVFARTLTRPIRDLTRAADALRQGSLGAQVPIRSRDELGRLALTFNQMSADLARATHARRQMTADIAHDLRTPLQVIGGYIDAMAEGDLEPTRERLATVYSEIEHLQHLVADLRTLSQADAGELPLNRQAVLPQELLERVAATYANQAAQQHITLTFSADPNLPPLYIDEDRIRQVLGNLLGNALRHTPDGGQITLAATSDAGGVCLAVHDSGEGIAAADLPYVFERFYRGDRARQDEAGASGLGLAIAKALVELHGGSIVVASPGPGAGASFTVRLPAASPHG
jgi:signal transduction histidine kinase